MNPSAIISHSSPLTIVPHSSTIALMCRDDLCLAHNQPTREMSILVHSHCQLDFIKETTFGKNPSITKRSFATRRTTRGKAPAAVFWISLNDK
jgi:hypothetical protein